MKTPASQLLSFEAQVLRPKGVSCPEKAVNSPGNEIESLGGGVCRPSRQAKVVKK